MEGMRLTIQRNDPDGVDFSIRMPHTPQRCGFSSSFVADCCIFRHNHPTGAVSAASCTLLPSLSIGSINLTWS